jgi:hypothetical protein
MPAVGGTAEMAVRVALVDRAVLEMTATKPPDLHQERAAEGAWVRRVATGGRAAWVVWPLVSL